jgi:tetratricopeptide (TPR) repeat protein
MKKTIILIAFLSFLSSFSQSTIKEMGEKTCDCIQKKSNELSFDEKFEKCAVANMVSEVKSGNKNATNVDGIKDIFSKLKTYIKENCEATIITDILKKEDLKEVSNESCKCIEKIDFNLKSKFDSVKECINTQLILYQMSHALKKVNIDSTSNKIIPKKINFLIETNTNSRLYKQVEADLLENCKYLGIIINTDNTKHVNSVTFDRKANKEYEIANEFALKKEYNKAIKHYLKAVKIDDKFAFAWDNLGIAYRRTKQYDKAIEAYKMSLKANPKGRVPLMNLGVAYNGDKQYKKAVKTYKIFIKNFKDDPEGYFGLSKSYLFLNKEEKALQPMIDALVLYTKSNSPYRADAENLIVYIYKKMKEKNQIDEFRKIMNENNINFEE